MESVISMSPETRKVATSFTHRPILPPPPSFGMVLYLPNFTFINFATKSQSKRAIHPQV